MRRPAAAPAPAPVAAAAAPVAAAAASGRQRRWQCQRDEEWRAGLPALYQAWCRRRSGRTWAAAARAGSCPGRACGGAGRRPAAAGRRRPQHPPSRIVAPPTRRAKEESIRIDAVKLDALLEVAGESVQAANQAAVLLER
jgi:two-component system chemotaxis sensor kinase CheA